MRSTTPLILFFDTETTGRSTQNDNIVQLAWILCHADGTIVSQGDFIVKPDGYQIPPTASKIHGIDTENAEKYGLELEEILTKFSETSSQAEIIVAHNISFDSAFIERAYKKVRLENPLAHKTHICTMRLSTTWCRLPKLNGHSGFKYPKLEELYYRLFGEDFQNAHNALADTEACMKSYFALVDKEVITPPYKTPAKSFSNNKAINNDNVDYMTGYADGYSQGKSEGYADGYSRGNSEGYGEGYDTAREETADIDYILRWLVMEESPYEQLFAIEHPLCSPRVFELGSLFSKDLNVKCAIAKRAPLTPEIIHYLLTPEKSKSKANGLLSFSKLPLFSHGIVSEELLMSFLSNPSLETNAISEIIYKLSFIHQLDHSPHLEDAVKLAEQHPMFDNTAFIEQIMDRLDAENEDYRCYCYLALLRLSNIPQETLQRISKDLFVQTNYFPQVLILVVLAKNPCITETLMLEILMHFFDLCLSNDIYEIPEWDPDNFGDHDDDINFYLCTLRNAILDGRFQKVLKRAVQLNKSYCSNLVDHRILNLIRA